MILVSTLIAALILICNAPVIVNKVTESVQIDHNKRHHEDVPVDNKVQSIGEMYQQHRNDIQGVKDLINQCKNDIQSLNEIFNQSRRQIQDIYFIVSLNQKLIKNMLEFLKYETSKVSV